MNDNIKITSTHVNTTDWTVKITGVCYGTKGTAGSSGLKKKISYVAASPPDRHTSFTGSGLPFPSAAHAFLGRPNRGEVDVAWDGSFSLTCDMPNSYYTHLGSVHVGPRVYLFVDSVGSHHENMLTVPISDGIPYRKLTYPNERRNANFYNSYNLLPIRGQEEILRSSEYPGPFEKEDDLFWGLRPPF